MQDDNFKIKISASCEMKTTSTFLSLVFFQWNATSNNLKKHFLDELDSNYNWSNASVPALSSLDSFFVSFFLLLILLGLLLCYHYGSCWLVEGCYPSEVVSARCHVWFPTLLIPYTQPCPIRLLGPNLHWRTLCLVRCCTQLIRCALRSPLKQPCYAGLLLYCSCSSYVVIYICINVRCILRRPANKIFHFIHFNESL
jgi:hypothetical protein